MKITFFNEFDLGGFVIALACFCLLVVVVAGAAKTAYDFEDIDLLKDYCNEKGFDDVDVNSDDRTFQCYNFSSAPSRVKNYKEVFG